MGEMADYLLNGDDCESCGLPFDDAGDGFPRSCAACQADDAPPKPRKPAKTIPCPACKRKFRSPFALRQHRATQDH